MDTATCLKGELQRREDELLQNFLVLWNKTKEDFQKEQLIRKENVDGNKKKGEAVLKPVCNAAPKGKKVEVVIDHEDEHDFVGFNPEDVDRYAAGIKFHDTALICDAAGASKGENPGALSQTSQSSRHSI